MDTVADRAAAAVGAALLDMTPARSFRVLAALHRGEAELERDGDYLRVSVFGRLVASVYVADLLPVLVDA